MSETPTRKVGSAVALLAAGLVAGGVLAGALTANAAGTPTPTPPSGATATNPNPGDTSKPQRSDETLLTGDTLAKVKAAVTAKYPGATFERAETDRDGAYEAHITKADGTRTSVEVSKAFAVTGEEAGHGGGGHRGDGGPGETALTGDALAKVKAAVSSKYAGATFDRVTTDSEGAYEAHITKADGTRTSVEVSKAFAVTGEETHAGHAGHGPEDSGSTDQAG
jgi:uncharacterized membrane protein YkoI